MSHSSKSLSGFVTIAVFIALACASGVVSAQSPAYWKSFRSSYEALLNSYDRVFAQEGDARGQATVARARTAMQAVGDQDFAKLFSQTAPPDMSPAVEAMQRAGALSRQTLQTQTRPKSLPFPSAPTVIDACINTPHSDQITYDALIAYQVTSGILAAAAWVCNEDILGENGSAACIPLAIANDIASSFFAVRSFCGGLDTSATVNGNYARLEHLHTDLTNAQTAIIDNTNAAVTSLTSSISASTTSILNNANSNTASIISNANANRDAVVAELRALGCEIVRLLNTPEGQRASSLLACSAQPGFPYSWNKR